MLSLQPINLRKTIKNPLRIILVTIITLFALNAYTQEPLNNNPNLKAPNDTTYYNQTELPSEWDNSSDLELQDELEEITTRNEEYYDFYDLLEESTANRQVNINTASEKALWGLGLNKEQIKSIERYIVEYGELSSVYELNLVEGFDSAFIQKIRPHIRFELDREIHKITTRNLLSKGKQMIVFRYNRNLQLSKAYQEDTAIYIGNPDKILLRYNYGYYDRLKLGITIEKDAGEKMPDYIGWHAYYGSKKMVKDLVLGSYNMSVGQGLNMSSSFGFSKSLSTSQFVRSSHSLRSSSGANENYGLNGIAATLRLPLNMELTMFYSAKKLDASKSIDSVDKEEFINTIYESGLHRTLKELKSKKAITNQVYGVSLLKRIRNLSLGIITHQTVLSAASQRKAQPYRLFDFTGDKLTVGGFHTTLSLKTIELFGETSVNLQYQGNRIINNKGVAGLIGMRIDPSGSTGFTILYRNFSHRYQNFYSNTFSESTSVSNEQGIYMGINSIMGRKITFSAYADFFKFPWLKYRINAPSIGCEYMVNLNYKMNPKDGLTIKYIYKSRQQNLPFNSPTPVVPAPFFNGFDDSLAFINNPSLIDFPQVNESQTFRLTFTLNPSHSMQLKSRIDYNFYHKDRGFLIAQDVIYKPADEPFQFYLRYALFDIESFGNRMYVYENDVLNSFTIPVFTGKGSRFYLMSKVSFNRVVDFWIRYSCTFYPSKNTIGQGMDEISGNLKSEIKFQIMVRM